MQVQLENPVSSLSLAAFLPASTAESVGYLARFHKEQRCHFQARVCFAAMILMSRPTILVSIRRRKQTRLEGSAGS
jgi:hypothetical protein